MTEYVRMSLVAAVAAAGLAIAPAASAESKAPAVESALRGAEASPAALKATSVRTFESGTVVTRFEQRAGGLPVQGTGAVVLDAVDSAPELLFDETESALAAPGEPALGRAEAIAAASRSAGVRERGGAATARLVVVPGGDGTLAWEVLVPSERPLGEFLVTLDASSGATLSEGNLMREATGQAKLFNPNAVVANDGYAGIKDRRDENSRRLNKLRESLTLAHLDDDTTCLRGSYAVVRESPAATSVCKADRDWRKVKRSGNRFEALMSYAHIDRAQDLLQGLDLGPINQESQNVIANAIADDNSFYLPRRDEIQLGAGGVDDGEDADVIVHEYGHAVQDAQNPDAYGGSGGAQAGAQGEGYGDYLAAVYQTETAGYDQEWTPCIMEWDATSYDHDRPGSPGICLRRADDESTWNEQKDRCGGADIHCIGEVWASALLDLRRQLGDDPDGDSVGDTLVHAAHEMTPASPSFKQAAEALIDADASEYLGIHCLQIEDEMEDRGFLSGSNCP